MGLGVYGTTLVLVTEPDGVGLLDGELPDDAGRSARLVDRQLEALGHGPDRRLAGKVHALLVRLACRQLMLQHSFFEVSMQLPYRKLLLHPA